jgi:ribonucleoside-diphosphate reductase alpha chain
MTKFEDVKHITTEEYFNNNQFSIDAFNKKYAAYEGETYVQTLKRVCDYVASVEKTNELKTHWSEIWFDEIYNDYWHPAGSIMQGAAVDKKISLMNCTHIALPEDSLESIFNYTAFRVAKTAAMRQGLGVHFEKLRPRKMILNNSAKVSEGAVHWMGFIDAIGYKVGQRGRIPAMLFSLNIKHPDIIEFINSKTNYTKIQNANISVQITNSFYEAVENNGEWELEFIVPSIKKGDKLYLSPNWDDLDLAEGKDENGYYKFAKFNRKKEIYKEKVNAVSLLELIAKNMHANAEPGIQNIDIAHKYSNSDYVGFPIIGTNACSEQYLDDQGNCDLASINCEKFYHPQKEIDDMMLEKIAESENRFLDNVVECEIIYGRYASSQQKRSLEYLRRTGAGITNIEGLLILNKKLYGEKDGNELIEKFQEKYNYYLYKSSIKLGKEKGNFLAFDREKYLKSPFIKNMMKKFPDFVFDHMRNVCVSTVAPTGTLSLMFRNMVLSYGIEPAFGLYYWKRTRMSGKYEYYFVVPNVVRKMFLEHGVELPMKSDTLRDTWDGKYGKPIAEIIEKHKDKFNIKIKGSLNIKALDKLDLMTKVMKSVDSSISVTYMLPENSNWKDVYNFILEAYKKEVKSIAAFPDKKMYGIISFIPFKELAYKLKVDGIEIHPQNFSDSELKELHISNDFIKTSAAPKRPSILPADIYSITVNGEKFVVAVGLLNNSPYEIFCGHMNGLNFKFKEKHGTLEKIKRGVYKLEIGEDISIDDFSTYFKPKEAAFFRMVSISLRHGAPIKFIVDQLSKSTEDMFSITSAASRVLKKYIKEGEIVNGAICINCSSALIYDNTGCPTCENCGWSKCM